MTENLCVRCGRPTADGYACSPCANRAGGQLHEIADMTLAARDVAHGLSRNLSGSGSSGKPGSRLPLDLAATSRLDAVNKALTRWIDHIGTQRGVTRPWFTQDGDPIAIAATWLVGHTEWIRHRGPDSDGNYGADQFLTDVDICAWIMRGVVDGRQPGRYAGPCGYVDPDDPEAVECREDVESRPGARYATCRRCGSRYDVDERQAWMRTEIEDFLARPVEIAGMLLRLGQPIGYSTIAAYAAKGQITAHGCDEKGKPLYRIGDVLDLRMGRKTPRRLLEQSRGPANPHGG